jgi:alkanesulfonate monooxygenase SsuD/methylene tetrahydromethanopterin reductase-like flavin-dependent oxidoreductase (luciferase family)
MAQSTPSQQRQNVTFGVIPAQGPRHLQEALAQVKLCLEYGVDSIWIEEHHDAGPYWPTPMLAIAALAPHLGPMRIGTGILVLPLHDPVHIAEQAAVIDILTDGRFTLGLGLGDTKSEFAAFRVPAQQRGARFEEQIAIIRALWSGERLTFHGRFYSLEDVQLATLPQQPGGPPIWIGGWAPRQLRRASELGDAWLPGPVGRLEEVAERQATYDALLRERGTDPLMRARPVIRDVVVATSDAKAWELAAESVAPAYRETYVESEHALVGRDSSASKLTAVQDLMSDRLIIGAPETVISELARCIIKLDASELVMRLKLPGLSPSQITQMLHLIGRAVLPDLRKASHSPDSLVELARTPV